VTALTEGATGLALLVWPAFPLGLLLGIEAATAETTVVARVAGAALLALGGACWPARNATASPAARGIVAGALLYDLVAVALLAHAGLALGMAGGALWPAVALHAAMVVWGAVALSPASSETRSGRNHLPD
jgi:hypothetical protein